MVLHGTPFLKYETCRRRRYIYVKTRATCWGFEKLEAEVPLATDVADVPDVPDVHISDGGGSGWSWVGWCWLWTKGLRLVLKWLLFLVWAWFLFADDFFGSQTVPLLQGIRLANGAQIGSEATWNLRVLVLSLAPFTFSKFVSSYGGQIVYNYNKRYVSHPAHILYIYIYTYSGVHLYLPL